MFGGYAALYGGDGLTIGKVLSCIAMVNVLRTSIGKEMSRATENGPECHIAVKRFQRFLSLPETAEKEVAADDDHGKAAVYARDADVRYPPPGDDSEPSPSVLSGVDFEVEKGELLVVLGPVGCGKSSLVLAVLGEMEVAGGRVGVGKGEGRRGFRSLPPPLHNLTPLSLPPLDRPECGLRWPVPLRHARQRKIKPPPRPPHPRRPHLLLLRHRDVPARERPGRPAERRRDAAGGQGGEPLRRAAGKVRVEAENNDGCQRTTQPLRF